jgi:cytidylate kinase
MAAHPSEFDTAVYRPVLTISASYGTGATLIVPRLAEHFGLPFIDRLLTVDVADEATRDAAAALGEAEKAKLRSSEGISGDERAASPGNRLFTYLARAASIGTITAPLVLVDTDDELRSRAEESLAGVRAGASAVVLGRAGAVILADRPRAYHVRLDGPRSRRITAAAVSEQISEARSAELQNQTDRSRELWVKRLYRADPTDPKWYHLWLDPTVLSADSVVALIVEAFNRYLAATAG